ncbi:unnamed protein product [Rotaria magnacalcarata]|uniref:Uncharacterized protein n=4 Tax=Rotaria magnacalcarata TaxID=392030 RepID=A0A8S2L0M6_9BILA|nr:unnamed protein product [Rotaria magnacalcarata]CAF3885401.1 unnamed protein product [Rotaria magnacalcarata]
MSTLIFSTTEKNKPLLICKGFAYTINKTTNDKLIGNVNMFENLNVKDKLTLTALIQYYYMKKDNHNHPATQIVIDYSLTNLSDNTVACLPDFKHVKRNIQNRRGKNDLPEIPHDKTFNLIPDKLTTAKRNSIFLQFDSGPNNDHINMFASDEQLQLLENCEQLLVDGTFKFIPVSTTCYDNPTKDRSGPAACQGM